MSGSTAQSGRQTVKAIIFDFDGTIADSLAVFIQALEVLLKREQPLTAAEIDSLRQLPAQEIMKRLHIKKWQLPALITKGRREVDKHMGDVVAFAGMPEALKQLSAKGYELFIVSSHSPEGIHVFLEKYGLPEAIKNMYGNVGLWSKPKTLKRLMRQYNLAPGNCVYVGDEIRDITAAGKAHVKSVAVSWGFNTPESLRAHTPAALVSQPSDLGTAIDKL